jgi:DNA topoisomerase-1
VKGFDDVFNVKFTANMEEELDRVEEGISWTKTVKKFWDPFHDRIEEFKERRDEMKEKSMKSLGRTCPQCGEGELVERFGRYGKFIACTNYPKCKYVEKVDSEGNAKAKEEPEKTGRTCPQCETGNLIVRSGRYGKFIACDNFPKCKYTEQIPGEEKKGGGNLPDISVPCPREGCGGTIVPKRTRRGKIMYGCSNWKTKKCDVVYWDPPREDPCPKCKYPIRVEKGKKLVCPECKHSVPLETESKDG